MSIPDVREAYTGKINLVTIGATKEQGGTRSRVVTIGGHTTIPFLAFEGTTNLPAIAFWHRVEEPYGYSEMRFHDRGFDRVEQTLTV